VASILRTDSVSDDVLVIVAAPPGVHLRYLHILRCGSSFAHGNGFRPNRFLPGPLSLFLLALYVV
jgi:hypothetical protein